jgi:hypothetical protein
MMDGEPCPKHVERLTEINKLRKVASFWLYTENISAMQGNMSVKLSYYCRSLNRGIKEGVPNTNRNFIQSITAF